MRKEEGATVAATPTFPHSGQLRQAGRQCLHGNLTLQESPIKYYKCPTNETNVKRKT